MKVQKSEPPCKHNKKKTVNKNGTVKPPNGNQIFDTLEYTYLGTTFSSNGSFATSKKNLVEKSRRSVCAMSKCNFLFDALFAPALLHSSEVWGAYDSLNLKKWEKDPIERFHSQFYKSYLGLNRIAPNVAARNETGKLPLKLIDFSNVTKFWLHLLKLPSSSVAGQCLQISTQLTDSGKNSFMIC